MEAPGLPLSQMPGQPGQLRRDPQGLAGQTWPSAGPSTGQQSRPAGSSPAMSSLCMHVQPHRWGSSCHSADTQFNVYINQFARPVVKHQQRTYIALLTGQARANKALSHANRRQLMAMPPADQRCHKQPYTAELTPPRQMAKRLAITGREARLHDIPRRHCQQHIVHCGGLQQLAHAIHSHRTQPFSSPEAWPLPAGTDRGAAPGRPAKPLRLPACRPPPAHALPQSPAGAALPLPAHAPLPRLAPAG